MMFGYYYDKFWARKPYDRTNQVVRRPVDLLHASFLFLLSFLFCPSFCSNSMKNEFCFGV